MAAFGEYDPTVKPMSARQVIPAGWYHAIVHASDVKTNSSRTGDRAIFQCAIVEGEHDGEEFEIALNIRNASPKAQDIAQRELKSLCDACGVNAPQLTEELHGLPFWVKLKVEPGNVDKATGKEYGPKNEACGYRSDKQGPGHAVKAEPAKAEPAQPAQEPAKAPAAGVPPWKQGR